MLQLFWLWTVRTVHRQYCDTYVHIKDVLTTTSPAGQVVVTLSRLPKYCVTYRFSWDDATKMDCLQIFLKFGGARLYVNLFNGYLRINLRRTSRILKKGSSPFEFSSLHFETQPSTVNETIKVRAERQRKKSKKHGISNGIRNENGRSCWSNDAQWKSGCAVFFLELVWVVVCVQKPVFKN